MNKNLKTKHSATIPIILASKEPLYKIGKINDAFFSKKCTLTKDPQSKIYKLVEERSDLKDNQRYTGTIIAEQTSKYLVLQYNPETNKLDAFPAGDWCSFKKEITYNTMSSEEAEEKMKSKSVLLDYIRNRGVLTKKTKEKKTKSNKGEVSSHSRAPIGSINDEDEEMNDKLRPNTLNRVEEQSEEELFDYIDPELKEIPSDIEDVLKDKKKEECYNESYEDALFDDEEIEEEDKDEDDEDIDDQSISDIDEYEDLTPDQINNINLNQKMKILGNSTVTPITKDQEFIGMKRKLEHSNVISLNDGKKQKINYTISMEEYLDNIFSKNRKMTYDKINKELSRNFQRNEIERQLPILLGRKCDKFAQGGEYFYFKKTEKY